MFLIHPDTGSDNGTASHSTNCFDLIRTGQVSTRGGCCMLTTIHFTKPIELIPIFLLLLVLLNKEIIVDKKFKVN